jgi:hypothetical protein
MRKVLAAATFGLVLGVAGASNSDEHNPESRVYLGFSFGGQKIAPRNFHYGLRIDHDSRFLQAPVAPLMQFDFTPRGFNDAHVNGLSVIRPAYRLRQAEEPASQEPAVEEVTSEPAAEAPAEEVSEVEEVEGEGEAAAEGEPGFFSRTWAGVTGFFDGLFGGGEEEVAEDAAAPAEAPAETAAADDVTEGSFLNYSVVDWGLLAVGAVGLGFAVGEVSNSSDSDDPGATTGGTPTGETAGGVGDTSVGGDTSLGGLTPLGLTSTHIRTELSRESRERLEWLDGGTGHMGDLEPRAE